jgi:hypothetical protein
MQMHVRTALRVDRKKNRRGYLYIWHLVTIEGCCYFSFFFSLIYFVIAISQTSPRARERQVIVHMYMNIIFLFSPSSLFFNPNATAAIIDSVIYPSFFFFFFFHMRMNAENIFHQWAFFVRSDDIRRETREKTECVCSLLQDTRRRQT